MRIILIIQALIIVGLAYYVYALRHSDTTVVVESLPENPVATTTPESPLVPELAPTSTEASPVSNEISGPNDAGMEWPIIESGLEVR